jgi:hypothetical protein
MQMHMHRAEFSFFGQRSPHRVAEGNRQARTVNWPRLGALAFNLGAWLLLIEFARWVFGGTR